jgi:Spore coat protein Z
MGCGRDRDDFDHKKRNCVCEAVRAIKDIQDNAVDECDECRLDCFLEPLGSMVSPSSQRPNTRIFKLYTKKGDVFKAHTKKWPYKSPFFRVKEVFDNCCATLQVVKHKCSKDMNADSEDEFFANALGENEWKLTGDCITVDLDCFCAIQCVKDVHVDLFCDDNDED